MGCLHATNHPGQGVAIRRRGTWNRFRTAAGPVVSGDTGKAVMSEGARDPATMAYRNRSTLGISVAATAGRLPLVLRGDHVVVEILP